MHSIREDRDAIGQQRAEYFDDGKSNIEPERQGKVLALFQIMMMAVVSHKKNYNKIPA